MIAAVEYIHPKLHETVQSISGHYVFIEEGSLDYQGKEVLFVVGVATVDNSCCGVGGCFFVYVPGYLMDRERGRTPDGRLISLVVPVREEAERAEIRSMIERSHPHAQVQFQGQLLVA